MKNSLAATPLHVEQQFVSGSVYFPLSGHITSYRQHMRYKALVRIGHVVDAADVPTRYDQIVYRGMGIDIFENNQLIVLEVKTGIGLAVNDVAEDALFFHDLPPGQTV
jgi:hypothetical protein